jgi:hypothetical protein
MDLVATRDERRERKKERKKEKPVKSAKLETWPCYSTGYVVNPLIVRVYLITKYRYARRPS